MKVFVTGATGFVGAHTARALLDAGHQVRLLVRSRANVAEYFAGFGHRVDDFVVADMRDRAAIEAAMPGCDAVVHAAALVSVDPRRAEEIYRNNVSGIDAVIGTAGRLGIGRIVYVSSLTVLFQNGVPVLTEELPLGNPKEAYARSKRDCEQYVRDLQAQGLPVQITYPAAIMGPDDPKLSEANYGLMAFLATVPRTTTGFQCIDVRDLAQVHRRLLELPAPSRREDGRFIVAGRYYPWAEMHRMLEAITRRKVTAMRAPGAMLRGLGDVTDALRKLVPFESHLSREAMEYVTQWVPADSRRVQAATGLAFRPAEDTLRDAIRWLAAAGHLKPKLAGALVEQAAL